LKSIKTKKGLSSINYFISKRLTPYLFISPFFILFLVFWVWPIIMSFYYSLLRWDGMSEPIFIGILNYKKLFSDSLFYQALKNTLILTFSYELILIPLCLIVAVLLNLIPGTLQRFFRSGYFIPVTMSSVVVAIIFNLVLGKNFGLLNNFLNIIGIKQNIDWLNNANTALWSILILRIWRNTGFYLLFIFAGLKAIPKALYEAATVDGANSRGIFFKITLPLLRPVITFVIFMSLIWQFQIFDEPWVLTGGGPNNATLTVLIYLYQRTFREFNLGYGSAISYIFTLIIAILSILQIKLISGRER